MNKQDRQGARTPADVERKYNLGAIAKSYPDTSATAKRAEAIASSAQADVSALNNSLDASGILNRLTGGTKKGIYHDENNPADKSIYINADYIMGWRMDYIEAQIAYMAMKNGMLLEKQEGFNKVNPDGTPYKYLTFDRINTWHYLCFWTNDMVDEAQSNGFLTEMDALQIKASPTEKG
jgi:hypothetical protein